MTDVRHIFRSYDIRGIYGKDITEEVVHGIGNVFAQYYAPDSAVIARDSRLSGQSLLDSFIKGAINAGKNMINIGEVPISAAMHFSTANSLPLAYVTASHLTKEWNGIKFSYSSGHGFLEEDNNKIRDTFLQNKFVSTDFGIDPGKVQEEKSQTVIELYTRNLASKMKSIEDTKILIDCGNGVTGLVARSAFSSASFSADVIFEEPDGNFPNRNSDPITDPLNKLVSRVREYDIGIAYDGDGDRMVLASKDGKLRPEQASYVILSELLKVHEGPIVANIDCSLLLNYIAKKLGSQVYFSRVGHTFIAEAVKKHNAVYGVESSGHYFMPTIVPYSDAIAASMYACYALQKSKKSLSNMVKELPDYPVEKLIYDCPDNKKFLVIEQLKKELSEKYGNINAIDGVRIDFDHGFVLVRASNTEPKIRLTIEGTSQKHLEDLKEEFLGVVERKIKS